MNVLQLSSGSFNKNRGGMYVLQKKLCKILNVKTLDSVTLGCSEVTEADYHLTEIKMSQNSHFSVPIVYPKLIFQLVKLDCRLIIIHSIFDFNCILGYFLSRFKKTPYLVFLHGALDPYVLSYNTFIKILWMDIIGKLILERADAVICTTLNELEKVNKYGKYLVHSNIEIFPLGVDPPTLKIENDAQFNKYEVRKKLGIPFDKKILLFIGRIHPMKRPIETALAFKELQVDDWVYLIVGNIPDPSKKDELQFIVDNDKVFYHPPVYDMEKWSFMTASDAFVHLSHRENFCYSVVEAASVGLPLLISDGVDIYPYFKSSCAADVLTIDSFDDIKEGVDNFLQKTEYEHKEMGRKAKRTFHENFSQSSFETRVLGLVSKYAKVKC